ncbi:MAG: hypothetical protein ACRCT1_12170 [Microcoleaceae cyanobacterium]
MKSTIERDRVIIAQLTPVKSTIERDHNRKRSSGIDFKHLIAFII